MSLAALTTADDVRSVAKYLKDKPAGANSAEVKAVLGAMAEPHKLPALLQWNILCKEEGRYRLSPLGWQLARRPKDEALVFRAILDSILPYRSVLEWIHHQAPDQITHAEVAAYWRQNATPSVDPGDENRARENAVCFFQLCQGAGLGKMTASRRGQSVRLDVNKLELRRFIEAGPSALPWTSPPPQRPTPIQSGAAALAAGPAAASSPSGLRVFISLGKNPGIVEQVQTLLDLSEVESEAAEPEETLAVPVADRTMESMRRCGAAIIAAGVDRATKDDAGNYTVDGDLNLQIGAAFVLYNRRMVLLWDKRVPVPSHYQGLYRCEYEGDHLSWDAGMKLMKAIQGFKS